MNLLMWLLTANRNKFVSAINSDDCSCEKGAIDDFPNNMYAEFFISFGNLLLHIDIMISNGDFGATQNALAHGIPWSEIRKKWKCLQGGGLRVMEK